jgi:hypothetical protein
MRSGGIWGYAAGVATNLLMPIYNTKNPPPSLSVFHPGNRELVFNKDTLTANMFSQQVSIPSGPTTGQRGIRVEIDFSVNPGAYEIDVMESDSDLENGPTEYQQVPTGGALTTVTTGVNGASTHQSSDLIPIAGQFVLLYVKTAPANACTCTARITRAA